jgi:hypothetical protein
MAMTFTGNPVPDLTKIYTPITNKQVYPLNGGWSSTSSGAGLEYQYPDVLALRSSTTSASGCISVYPSVVDIGHARIGTDIGVGVGGYGTMSFINEINIYIRMGSIFNHSVSATSWGFAIGSNDKAVTSLSALFLPTLNNLRGYVGVRCLSGDVTLVTHAGNVRTENSVSNTLDTWGSSQNHKSYRLNIKSGTASLYNAFTDTLLGSLTGAPTNSVVSNPPQIGFTCESIVPSTTVNGGIAVYGLEVFWNT